MVSKNYFLIQTIQPRLDIGFDIRPDGYTPQIGIVLIGWSWMEEDMLYTILIPEASWLQKCNF